jgi:prepilin-type N-terminal cleavage/methylation domain-containing protein
MNTHGGRSEAAGFTLIELLVVIAIILIVVVFLVPRHPRREPLALRAQCLSNQKQVALGLILFASDNSDLFPWQTSVTNGGAKELSDNGDVVPACVAITNYFRDLRVLHCRTDKKRSAALPGAALARTNLSYFLGFDAALTNSPANIILTGDRNLESDGKPVQPGFFMLSTSKPLAWTSELHSSQKKDAGGAMSFADGHAEWVRQRALIDVVARQGRPTNLLAIP